ncbi:MAG: FtsB family cell division protein [Desulfonatronovibrionaceae bacterium]
MTYRVVTGFLWIVIVILLAELFVADNGVFDYLHLRSLYEDKKEENRCLQEENRRLSREIELLRNDARYRMKMVRERLHYVAGDEVIYVFPDADQDTGD